MCFGMTSRLRSSRGATKPGMRQGETMPVYAEYQPRGRFQPSHVSDVVPWRAVLAPGIVLQKYRHGLQRSYAMRGPDVQGETPEVQGALMLQANEVLKRLGGRWMLQSEAQRRRVAALPAVPWRHPVAALMEREQRQRLLERAGGRGTRDFLTLPWYPPAPSMRRGVRFLVQGPGAYQDLDETTVSVREFVAQAGYLMDLLRGMLAVCRPLSTAETLTYLHSCVSERWHEVAQLAILTDLDIQLCDTPFVGGGGPHLGSWRAGAH